MISIHPKKVCVSQSEARKKTISYLKYKIFNTDSKMFPGKQNLSSDDIFLFQNFEYNAQETLLVTSCYVGHLPAVSELILLHFAITRDLELKMFFASVKNSNGPLRK